NQQWNRRGLGFDFWLIYRLGLLRYFIPLRWLFIMEILKDLLLDLLELEATNELSVSGENKATRFFRDSYNQRIAVFAHADGRPVPESELRRQVIILAYRQNTARCFDPSFINNDRAIVHWAALVENGQEQSLVHLGVDEVTCFNIEFELRITGENDQGSCMRCFQCLNRFAHLVDVKIVVIFVSPRAE